MTVVPQPHPVCYPLDAASLRIIGIARKVQVEGPGWYDLAPWQEWAAKLVRVRNRDGSKRQVKLADDYDLLGLLGELTVSLATGLPFDTSRTRGGDEEDFPDTDVKACRYRHGHEATLKHPVNASRWHGFYVLVAVEPDAALARIVGTCTGEHLRGGPVQTFRAESGEQHVRTERELMPGLPSHLLAHMGGAA